MTQSRPLSSWPALHELALRHGVSTEYWDWQGHHISVSVDAATAVLTALGVSVDTEEDAQDALLAHDEAPWRRMLPPVLLAREGRAATVEVHVRHGDPLSVDIRTENAEIVGCTQLEHNVPPRDLDGDLVGEARFSIPADLPVGYHSIRAHSAGTDAHCLLVVSPDRLALPAALDHRVWGLMTQLYSVRSRDSWGLGDFADLGLLARTGAELGADFVLVNPLHAAEPMPPIEDSPYLPTSRRFINPLYIRVEDITETTGLTPVQSAWLGRQAARLRACNTMAKLLDRQSTWQAKLTALDLVFRVPRSQERQRGFEEFRRRQGQGLVDFATWSALAEHFGAREWPEWASHPATPEVAALAKELNARIDFFAWLQWIADEQLASAQRVAREAGMGIGIMTDLAVGVHPSGADVWTLGPALARGINVGAPPDAFNQIGQDWSQPPWRPDMLAELGYAPYRDMLRAALRHAGGLRIDHVMGLFRLWCIPAGMPPTEGAYVRYDHEAMVSILLVEAFRAGAFVVGEDLGVVEPFVRDYLVERGVLGTSILWFEADNGSPRPPESYRELCLASVTTHDLPPTAGYLAGEHVHLRDSLNLLTRPLEDELDFAEAEQDSFLRLLRERGLLSEGATEEAVIEALHSLLTQTPAKLLGVSVADLVGDRRAQNQPGTHTEYPNWRIPLTDTDGRAVLLEDLAISDRARSLTESLSRRLAEQ